MRIIFRRIAIPMLRCRDAHRILKIEFIASPTVWIVGLVSATLLALLAGWLGTRSVLNTSPLRVLREG